MNELFLPCTRGPPSCHANCLACGLRGLPTTCTKTVRAGVPLRWVCAILIPMVKNHGSGFACQGKARRPRVTRRVPEILVLRQRHSVHFQRTLAHTRTHAQIYTSCAPGTFTKLTRTCTIANTFCLADLALADRTSHQYIVIIMRSHMLLCFLFLLSSTSRR